MPDTAAPTRRLFIGLFPSPAVQAAIVAHGERWYWPQGCRRTRPGRLHMTLHFLGNVSAPREAALRNALADTPMHALTLVLSTPQAWNNHIAVLLPDESPALRALHATLAQPLARSGLQPSHHRWTPHVTLARDAPGAGPPDAPCSIPWAVHEVVLVWSHSVPAVRYEALARYPLAR
ncbi:MAG TPA: RNA 2',3'-cyclic phosphodiesterase [Ideonella sp.]|nr:RNA 2',3'-cyclic phosphodiesterase [Ideonella sp.]